MYVIIGVEIFSGDKNFNIGYILGAIVLALITIQNVLDAIEVLSLEFLSRKLPTDFWF